ncbi:MAG: DUF488 domain-containing protein [Candidatus Aminicenantia bacterium]
MNKKKVKGEVYDIGHSTREKESFISILKKNQIEVVVDVRRYPRSKNFPHFNREQMEKYLSKEGIVYMWMGESLGGFRKGGYEKWSRTDWFLNGVKELEKIAEKKRTVILCAEGFWMRCHRRFILEKMEKSRWKIKHL